MNFYEVEVWTLNTYHMDGRAKELTCIIFATIMVCLFVWLKQAPSMVNYRSRVLTLQAESGNAVVGMVEKCAMEYATRCSGV